MSKKRITGTKKTPTSKPVTKQEDTTYLVRADLDDQQQGPAGAGAFKKPAPVAVAEQPRTAAAPAKPLAPLAALWPSSAPPRAEADSIQRPMPQKAPVTAVAPKVSPAAATPSPKPPAQLAPPTSPEESALAGQTPKPTAAKAFKVTFALFEPNAKHVSLCGEFNGWASDATPMKRDDRGNWETTVALPPGRYEYKFIVDGQWIPDPQARESVWNYHGTLNSVVQVWA
jgi:hypothetical protein